jgi:hypothetical protein
MKTILFISGVGGCCLIVTGALILTMGRYPFAGYLDLVAGIGMILAMVHGAMNTPMKPGSPAEGKKE